MSLAKSSQTTWLAFCSLPTRIITTLRRHGPRAACRRAWRRAAEAFRERRLGIRTAGSIDAAALRTGADNFGYQPIPYAAFETALEAIQAGPRDVFVDLGCGLGRAVVLAGLHGFDRVLGIEISPELCSQARENVARARGRLRTREIEIIEADARQYTVPPDATVLLLFNPFDEPILRGVLDNVRQSLREAPRALKIIYAIPTSRRDLLAEVPWLELRQTLRIDDEEWLQLGIYHGTKDGR